MNELIRQYLSRNCARIPQIRFDAIEALKDAESCARKAYFREAILVTHAKLKATHTEELPHFCQNLTAQSRWVGDDSEAVLSLTAACCLMIMMRHYRAFPKIRASLLLDDLWENLAGYAPGLKRVYKLGLLGSFCDLRKEDPGESMACIIDWNRFASYKVWVM